VNYDLHSFMQSNRLFHDFHFSLWFCVLWLWFTLKPIMLV